MVSSIARQLIAPQSTRGAVQALGRQHMGPDQAMDRLKHGSTGPDLIRQRREAEIDTLLGVALGLAVERLVLPARHCPRTNGGQGSLSNRTIASRFGPAHPRGVGWNGAGD